MTISKAFPGLDVIRAPSITTFSGLKGSSKWQEQHFETKMVLCVHPHACFNRVVELRQNLQLNVKLSTLTK